MKKWFLLIIVMVMVLASCNSQKKYSNFDISYSRSGGFAPIYENLLIKGTKLHYSFEGQGQKIKKDIYLTDAEVQNLMTTLADNNFSNIREDNKKIYDKITTIINVKVGQHTGAKSDASLIIPADQQRWDRITQAFSQLIKDKNLNNNTF